MSFGKNNDELRAAREAMLSGIGVTPDSALSTVFETVVDRLRDRMLPLGVEPTLDEVEAEITQFFDAFAIAARFVRMPKVGTDVIATVVNLKYRDLGADWSFRFVREARGAIFEVLYDTAHPACGMTASLGYTQIGYPFPKFFNLGEPYAPKFSDFADLDLRIEEKVDGSLITVCQSPYGMAGSPSGSAYADVIISTSGTPGAGSRMGDSSMTFADGVTAIFPREAFQALFARLAGTMFSTYPRRPDLTLIFELVTPQNANVVAYTKPRLCLLGAYVPALGELPPAWCDAIVDAMNAIRADSVTTCPMGVIDRPKTFALSDLSDAGVRALVGAWNGSQAEGVVVVGSPRTMGARDYALRMKVKAPDYAVKHSAFGGKSSLSWSHCLYFAARGTLDDVLAARPLQAMRLLEAQRLLTDMARDIDALFDAATAHVTSLGLPPKDTQKAFALYVNGRAPRLAGYCFGARRAALSGKPVKASDLFLAAVVEDRTVGSSLIPDPTGIGETPEADTPSE